MTNWLGNPAAPADEAAAVVTSDSADLSIAARALYIGVAGDVVVDLVTTGNTITFKNAQTGSIIPVRVKRVRATGTTATNIVALY